MVTANQRKPSKWMLLAIAQSLIWFFGVPIICRKYWDALFGSMSDRVADFTITTFTPILVIFIYNIIMLPIYYFQHPFFEQFKIQRDRPWPWRDERENVRRAFWALSARSVKLTLINMFILLPIMAIQKILLIQSLGKVNPSAFRTDDESWPSMMDNSRDLILLTVLHEFGFYSAHRLMHTFPSLYQYHKVHHEYKCNTTLGAQHNHPVDFILSIGGPGLLTAVFINPHSSTFFQWFLWVMYANLDDHVGYSFPWSPVRWFPLSASTDEHEFHHSKNLGCFASKLSIFNSLLGGYEQYSTHVRKSE